MKKRKNAFGNKYWFSNIFEHRCEDLQKNNIKNDIFGGGLFVQKKLVIIFWLPKDSDSSNKNDKKVDDLEQYFLQNLESIWEDTILIVVSFVPDKRKKFYKFLSQNVNLKIFNRKKEVELKKFIKDFFENKNIWEEEIDLIIEKVGTDLFALNNEMNKLKAYCDWNKLDITKENIEKIVYTHKETDAFQILDKLFFDKQEVVKKISNLQEEWEEALKFLWMLNWWCRNLLQIIDYYQRGEKDSKKIAQNMWVHPFVVIKNIKTIQRLISKKEAIRKFSKTFLQIDYDVKTWTLPQEFVWFEIKKMILSW